MAKFNETADYNMSDITSISLSEFKELKKLCSECEDGGIFKFKNIDVLKDYAIYLIEYLDEQFKVKENNGQRN